MIKKDVNDSLSDSNINYYLVNIRSFIITDGLCNIKKSKLKDYEIKKKTTNKIK